MVLGGDVISTKHLGDSDEDGISRGTAIKLFSIFSGNLKARLGMGDGAKVDWVQAVLRKQTQTTLMNPLLEFHR